MKHGITVRGDEELNRRIVLLEADEDIRELFTLVLQEHGFEIHLYDQVFENLEEVERLSLDLMHVDVFIGGTQEGWECVHRLKTHPPPAYIPLILCTAAKLTPEQESATSSHGIPLEAVHQVSDQS